MEKGKFDAIILYFNEYVADLEARLRHELGVVCEVTIDMVGINFLKSKNIKGNTLDEVIDNCVKELVNAGIIKSMTYSLDSSGVYLTLKIKGCIHLAKETKLKKDGVSPFTCPIENMINDHIIELLGWEYAAGSIRMHVVDFDHGIDENKGECTRYCTIGKTAATIAKKLQDDLQSRIEELLKGDSLTGRG